MAVAQEHVVQPVRATLSRSPDEAGIKASGHIDGQQGEPDTLQSELGHDRRGPPRQDCRSSEQGGGEDQVIRVKIRGEDMLSMRGAYGKKRTGLVKLGMRIR